MILLISLTVARAPELNDESASQRSRASPVSAYRVAKELGIDRHTVKKYA
jgi:hypothetical protein